MGLPKIPCHEQGGGIQEEGFTGRVLLGKKSFKTEEEVKFLETGGTGLSKIPKFLLGGKKFFRGKSGSPFPYVRR